MRFRDGYWRHRENVVAHYPQRVLEATASASGVHMLAPTMPVASRSDMLRGPVLSVDVEAVAPDVVGVRVVHHQGSIRRSAGSFDLLGSSDIAATGKSGDASEAGVEVGDDEVVVRSGRLEARIARDRWDLRFEADGQELTNSMGKSLGIVERSGQDGSVEHHLVEQLHLGLDEHIYGLGERFGPLVKNGQRVDTWNADGGTASELAYKNVSFYMSDRGYGVFVNHPGPVSFEVGSQTVTRVQFSVEDHALEYLVIYGASPAEVLERYTALTGRPALPPRWSFGLWLTTSFTTDYDEQTVNSFIDGMAERDLPLSVFHFDCFWMRGYRWTDFEWDPDTFPDPAGMVERLHDRGLRVCLWINPYIAQESRLFAEGAEAGYLLRRPDGRVWQGDDWQPGMALVDFSNPDATRWYCSYVEALLDLGVDSFKTDFGERIPTDVVYHDGSDPMLMHNVYTQLYNAAVFDAVERRRGSGEALVFARSATAGGQQFPVHWGGDCESTFDAMAETLRGGLSLAASGFGFWSHDIGGFEGTPDPELFKRWIAFGLLSSHSRLHGSKSYRVPWLVDEESVDVLRHFVALKQTLMPYLWSASVDAHQRGTPVMRPMVFEFPNDPAVAYLDRQYLLGGNLLVAPVLHPGGRVSYYLPAGRWTTLDGARTEDGPCWIEESVGVFELPVWVRPGTLLPRRATPADPDSDPLEDLLLTVYGLADGAIATCRVPNADGGAGATFTASRHGSEIRVERTGSTGAWRAAIAGHEALSADAGDDLIVATAYERS